MNSYIKHINNYPIKIIKNSTTIQWLLYQPQMDFNNDNDILPGITKGCSIEVSDINLDLMDSLSQKYNTHGIVEIGVSRNGERSFTNKLLKHKPDNIPYLGIDINNKSYLNNENKKIFTLQIDSHSQQNIRSYIKQINMEKISILFIDGWHSLNAVINDWSYSDLLSENGIVVLHDTNYHPGPSIILDAIDPCVFDVKRYFENIIDDYGMAVAYRL